MLIAQVLIVPAENSNGIGDIGPSGGHGVHEASNHRLVYCQITCFFIVLPLLKLHRHWRGDWPVLIHSALRQDRPNVAELMDVQPVMLPIVFNIHTEMKRETPKIMDPEHLLLLVLDLPNQALVTNDKEILNVQNESANYVMIHIMEHEQCCIDT
jgi:hypothetical protein